MKRSKRQAWRRVIQGASLIFFLAILLLAVFAGKRAIHEVCAYSVVCFGVEGGGLLRLGSQIMKWAIVAGIAVAVYSMFWGRRFCSYICVLGTLQELLYSLRGKKYRSKHRTPFHVDQRLAWLKYLILLVTLLLAAFGYNYLFIRLCPIYGLSLLPRLLSPGLAVLAVIALKSLFGDRQWCRFLCPYAALMNAFQWLGEMVGVRRTMVLRNLERCTDCGVCMLYCPMNINIAASEYVQDHNCIHCGLCADHCPKPGTYSEERECVK